MVRFVIVGNECFDITAVDGPERARTHMRELGIESVRAYEVDHDSLQSAEAAKFAGARVLGFNFYDHLSAIPRAFPEAELSAMA